MGISTNSVIHFTSELKHIKGILQNKFKLKYCKEKIIFGDEQLEIMVPMVSFCDIPLSEVKDHISKYGCYGIGLTKSWAQKNGLNPVLYLEAESYLSESLKRAFKEYLSDDDGKVRSVSDSTQNLLDVFRYIKNYEADLERKDTIIENYRFSDEREWRFVPKTDSPVQMSVGYDYFNNEDNQEDLRKNEQELAKIKLSFSSEDISYLIIKDESEIHNLLNYLKDDLGAKFSYKDIERLSTRILTSEQIMSDF
ncbi:TPA: hypothetical protein PMB05_003494 [Vibrio cholerae]|nr:hypothetical protein [Vibrio cholerae]